MIGSLCAELDLTQAFVGVFCGAGDRLPEEVGIHEMGAGAGRQEASVADQAQAPLIDLPVPPHCCLDGAA